MNERKERGHFFYEMIIVNCHTLVFLLYFSLSIYENGAFDLDSEYGPYKLKWEKFTMCKGSKPPCGNVEISNLQNASDFVYTMNLYRDCVIGHIRIVMSIKGKKTTKEYLNYSINKPCQHFLAGPIIRQTYGNDSMQRCTMRKGKHEHHFDVKGLTHRFLGPKFFYGTFSFRTLVNNKKYHIFCHDAEIVSEKIK